MDKIRNLIAKGKLEKALELLNEEYNSNELTLLQARLNSLNRDVRLGIMYNSEENMQRNQITISALDLLTELETENSSEDDHQSYSNEAEEKPEKQSDVQRGGGKRIYPKEVSNIIEIEGNVTDFIPFREINGKVKILFLSATPSGEGQLNPGRESRFKDLLKYFDDEIAFEWIEQHGINVEEFSNFLIYEEPHILHYGGHGEVEGIVLEDGNLEGDILRDILGVSEKTQCVVLNACYSVAIAKKVAEVVPYVIGTQGAIDDRSAIAFARGFYMGIVAGNPIEKAFKLGLIKIRQKKLPNKDIPILVKGVKKTAS